MTNKQKLFRLLLVCITCAALVAAGVLIFG